MTLVGKKEKNPFKISVEVVDSTLQQQKHLYEMQDYVAIM